MKTIPIAEWFDLLHEEKQKFTGIVHAGWCIEFFENGKHHNLDGPAVIYVHRPKDNHYMIYGVEYTIEQHQTLSNFIKYKKL